MINPWSQSPDPSVQSQPTPDLGALLANPQVNSALLASGLAMMQPPSFGDTPMSQIARAIGAGGEAVRSQDAQDIAQRKQNVSEQEAASKQDLRGAQAETSVARAGAAQTTAQAAQDRIKSVSEASQARDQQAADRLIYQREKDEKDRQLRSLGTHIKLSNAYNTMKTGLEKQNANNALLGQPTLPVPSFEEFVTNNPNLKTLYDGQGAQTPASTPVSPPSYGTQSQTPAPTPAAPAATAASAIPAPQDRRNGLQVWSPKLGRNVIWNATTQKWD